MTASRFKGEEKGGHVCFSHFASLLTSHGPLPKSSNIRWVKDSCVNGTVKKTLVIIDLDEDVLISDGAD